jgi:DNA-binding winged helix-turn-helix (wHTH) protein/predicted Zn-dependent protease
VPSSIVDSKLAIVTGTSIEEDESPFVVGEWTIDPDRRCVTRGDTVVRLSPRGAHVLTFLADRAGQVVSRDELIARFWNGAESSANAVHKVVAELRHVFAQAGDDTTYIETIPRRGYRLAVPVGGRAPPAVLLGEPIARPGERSSKPRLATRVGIGIVVIASVAIAGWYGYTRLATREEVNVGSQRSNTVAVLAVRSLDGGADAVQVAGRLADALRGAVAEWPGMTLVDPVGPVPQAAPDAIGAKIGAALVLDCAVERADDRIRTRMSLYRTRDRALLYVEQFERPAAAVDELQRVMTGNLLAALEVVQDDTKVADMRAAGTQNVSLYLALKDGQALHRRHGPRSMEFAAQRFRDVIAIDPNFRGAYGELASAIGDLAAIALDTSTRRTYSAEIVRIDETLLPARKDRLNLAPVWLANNWSIANSPRDVEWRFRSHISSANDPRIAAVHYPVYASLLASAHLDVEATRLLERFAALGRDDPWMQFHALDVATWMKAPHHAIAFERQIVEAYPDAVDVLCGLVADLASTGRFDEAQRYLDRLREADADGRWAYLAQLTIAAVRGDLQDPGARDRALADPRATDYARGVVHFIRGDVEAGLAAWKRVDADAMLGLVLRTVAFEKLFSDSVRSDDRYRSALDALGVGPGWTEYMKAQWSEVEETLATAE